MKHKPKVKRGMDEGFDPRFGTRDTAPDAGTGSPSLGSKRRWTPHDIAQVRPSTPRQAEALQAWFQGDHVGLLGSVGTGKSFIASYLALRSLTEGEVERIVIVRSAVQSRDQGFLPGTDVEKMAPFEVPYRGLFAELCPLRPNSYDDMKREGLVEFVSTSFLRGITIDHAVVILEEAQNLDFAEINTVMTRAGQGTRILITGDTLQNDLARDRRGTSGLALMRRVAKRVPSIALVDFTRDDIVRSAFVKQWVIAVEDLDADDTKEALAA